MCEFAHLTEVSAALESKKMDKMKSVSLSSLFFKKSDQLCVAVNVFVKNVSLPMLAKQLVGNF